MGRHEPGPLRPPVALAPPRPLRLVVFGGGTGLSVLLRGLAEHRHVETTAVVAVTDDGGSTGRLRRDLGVPALGDARKCLSALAESGWEGLLEHRFTAAGPLSGHALGNLLLAAAHEHDRLLSRSLARVGALVGARGRVLPATDVAAALEATLADGRVLRGESVLGRSGGSVARLKLVPDAPLPAPGVREALQQADLIVLGPGSLFSSVVAAALPAAISRALARSPAPRLFVLNLTTQRGETEGLDATGHLRAARAHLGPRSVDAVLAHVWAGPVPPQGLAADPRALAGEGVEVVSARMVAGPTPGRLHDPAALAAAVLRYARRAERRRAAAP